MNKRVSILAPVVALFVLTACNKSFLDTNDPRAIFADNYFKDSASLAKAVTGIYNALQPIFGTNSTGLFLVGDVATDNSYSRVSSVPNWNSLTIESDDAKVRELWIDFYRCIGRANTVIENAPGISLSDTTRSRYIGEAKFIRALCYFYVVRLWGDAPLVTKPFITPEDAYVDGRTAADDIYKLIISDVSFAYDHLPDFYLQNSKDAGRATKAAAIALWGQVLLTQKKFGDAVQKLSEIVDNESRYNVRLLPGYANIFSTDNEMNDEIIFAVRYSSGALPSLGSSFNNQFMPIGSENASPPLSVGTAYSGNLIHPDLRDAFEEGDTRFSASVDSVMSQGHLVMYTKKYLNPGSTVTNDGNNDWIVYRYAGILLLYAEALNDNGQSEKANEIVTRVRGRAGLLPLTYTNKDDLSDKILHERRVELNMEGKRWFDLLRSGKLVSLMNEYSKKYEDDPDINLQVRAPGAPPIEDYRVKFPIPLLETQVNPKLLPNNPGY